MDFQTSPSIAISSLVSQLLITWAYKNPQIKWLNKSNVRLISAGVSGLAAIVVAWLSGSFTGLDTPSFLSAAWNALQGAGLSVAFYEWTRDAAAETKPMPIDTIPVEPVV